MLRRLTAALFAAFILHAVVLAAASSAPLGQRGCCSHHQGVCGCSGGRTQCCDGTQSPSCTC
jgi:hypothetical protein